MPGSDIGGAANLLGSASTESLRKRDRIQRGCRPWLETDCDSTLVSLCYTAVMVYSRDYFIVDYAVAAAVTGPFAVGRLSSNLPEKVTRSPPGAAIRRSWSPSFRRYMVCLL